MDYLRRVKNKISKVQNLSIEFKECREEKLEKKIIEKIRSLIEDIQTNVSSMLQNIRVDSLFSEDIPVNDIDNTLYRFHSEAIKAIQMSMFKEIAKFQLLQLSVQRMFEESMKKRLLLFDNQLTVNEVGDMMENGTVLS